MLRVCNCIWVDTDVLDEDFTNSRWLRDSFHSIQATINVTSIKVIDHVKDWQYFKNFYLETWSASMIVCNYLNIDDKPG